jgi:hypothetical protein
MKIPANIKTKKSREELNAYFYEQYDEHFFFNKVRAMCFVYEAAPETENEFERFTAGLNAPFPNDYKWRDALTVELYFTSFLQFESLFSLLIAEFQDQPHWIYLNNYTPREIKSKIESFIKGDFTALTNGLIDNKYDFIDRAVYSKRIKLDENLRNNWKLNLHNADFVLRTIAAKYLEKAIEYNGYKHGLRLSRVVESKLYIPGMPAMVSDQTIGYLDIAEDEDEKVLIHQLKSINPSQSFYELYLMHRIVALIKMTRLSDLKNEDIDVPKGDPNQPLFFGDVNSGWLKGSGSMDFSLSL